jgi:uncharacterized Zn finger protein
MEQQQMNLNITLDKTTPVTCDECGGETFQEVVLLRKASRFVTGTSQDALIPIPSFACVKCGHLNEDLLPPQLRNNEDTKSI